MSHTATELAQICVKNDIPFLTPHEVEVLEMIKGLRKWEQGAWVNACVEFLQEDGYVTRSMRITAAGEQALDKFRDAYPRSV